MDIGNRFDQVWMCYNTGMITQELVPPKEKPATLRMSCERFLAWAGEDTHAEWVDD